MEKEDKYFIDWENLVFGYGYGTGEDYTLKALKDFMRCIEKGDITDSYDHRELEEYLGSTVAWLMITILCKADIIKYSSSPRYGWLTEQGKRLHHYLKGKTVDELYELVTYPEEILPDYHRFYCNKEWCNCGDEQIPEKCKNNPFF